MTWSSNFARVTAYGLVRYLGVAARFSVTLSGWYAARWWSPDTATTPVA